MIDYFICLQEAISEFRSTAKKETITSVEYLLVQDLAAKKYAAACIKADREIVIRLLESAKNTSSVISAIKYYPIDTP